MRDAPIGNRKSAIYTPAKVREDGRKKKFYDRSHQVIENKGSKNKLTEKKRTFWFKCRTFWFNVVTFWRGYAAFFGHFGMTW
jgi:hypothetical protein